MVNQWVQFVRQYARENNISYGCAISEAGPAYRNMKQDRNQKEEEKKELINEYENDLKDNLTIYHRNIDAYIILGKRMPPMKQRETRASKNQYNIIKKKLEELTNLKYPDLKDEATIKKESNKSYNQYLKEEAKKDRLRMEEEKERKEYNLRHGIEEEKPFSPKKKKKRGVII
jgi:hypothetical protein